MTANNWTHPDEKRTQSFWPHGWDHLKPEFLVPLTVSRWGGWIEESEFVRVKRGVNGNAFELWCGGVGETFHSAAQVVHHIRLLAREIGNK